KASIHSGRAAEKEPCDHPGPERSAAGVRGNDPIVLEGAGGKKAAVPYPWWSFAAESLCARKAHTGETILQRPRKTADRSGGHVAHPASRCPDDRIRYDRF